MNRIQKLFSFNIALLGLILLSILIIDKPLSIFVAGKLVSLKPFFYNFTISVDKFSASIFWLLLLSFVLGLFFLFSKKTKQIGFILLTLAFTHVTASVMTNTMKTVFKRARPEMYLEGNNQNIDFNNKQTKDYSFPSGHTSFYLSLFLPAALAFRRYALLFLLIPSIVIIGRIIQNEHYLSDVLCSVLIVYDVCFLTYWLFCWLDNALTNTKKKKAANNINLAK